MATGMKINNIAIPSPMDELGTYHYDPGAIVGKNGRGTAIAAPFATLTWAWEHMSLTEYTYWRTTLLAGAASAAFTANTLLYDDLRVLRTVTQCIVYRPTYERTAAGGYYLNVQLVIDQIKVS